MTTLEFDLDLDWGEGPRECTVEITDYTPGRPAQLSGPPERCYEAEPPDIEYNVWYTDDDGEGHDVTLKLSDHTHEMLYEMCIKRLAEAEEAGDDFWADLEYESRKNGDYDER